MKSPRLLSLLAVICLTTVSTASTPPGGDLDLSWYTIDGGGEMSSAGGDYVLSGTIGQPEAGALMAGGGFTLTSGFWAIASCTGDFDQDYQVAITDLLILLTHWGPCPQPASCMADVDGDGQVAITDLLQLLAAWGPC